MLDQCAANTGIHPAQALVDAGYCCDANLDAAARRHAEHGTETLIATGRLGHHEQVPPAPRGRIPRPSSNSVSGQTITCQNAGTLLLRGQDAARGEWRLLAACHNLLKIFRHIGTAGPTTAGPADSPVRRTGNPPTADRPPPGRADCPTAGLPVFEAVLE